MTTKQYWPLQAEKIDRDFRDRFPPQDSQPATRWSWDTDEGGSDDRKDNRRATVREVPSDDVEAKAGGGDDVVGSTSLYDENGKLRLIPVSTKPSRIRLLTLRPGTDKNGYVDPLAGSQGYAAPASFRRIRMETKPLRAQIP